MADLFQTVALNQSDYNKYPDIQMYPVLATAIVPVYNLNGPQNLILSTTVLSQIFSGQIKYALFLHPPDI